MKIQMRSNVLVAGASCGAPTSACEGELANAANTALVLADDC